MNELLKEYGAGVPSLKELRAFERESVGDAQRRLTDTSPVARAWREFAVQGQPCGDVSEGLREAVEHVRTRRGLSRLNPRESLALLLLVEDACTGDDDPWPRQLYIEFVLTHPLFEDFVNRERPRLDEGGSQSYPKSLSDQYIEIVTANTAGVTFGREALRGFYRAVRETGLLRAYVLARREVIVL